MAEFETVPADDPRAQRLLSNYFDERAATFPVALGTYSRSPAASDQFVPPAGVFLLALNVRGDAVGCGGIRRIADRETHDQSGSIVRFEVKHLWVDPAARGTGIGRALLSELEDRARGFGADEVVLDTNDSLTAAAALYQRGGYHEIPAYNSNPNATTWYSKPLG
jgi:GNAT superfamily N-acetyltransferase